MDGAASALAIVGAAATAVKVIKQLKDFASNVQVVDETVQSLCGEVESLQTVLELISNAFAKIEPILEENEPIRRVWKCVERTGDDCLQAIGKLNQIFRRLGKSSTSNYRAVIKQLKLQSGASEIAEIRRQLGSHQMAFQTSLTSIILCIVSKDQNSNHNVLDVVFSRLEDRLDELTDRLRDLKTTMQDRENTSVTSDDSEELIENLEECKESAHAIYNTASSVVLKQSTSGSEAANPLTAAQKDRIFEWAQRSSLSDLGTAEPSVDGLSTAYCESTLGSDTTIPTTVYDDDRVDTQENVPIISGEKLFVRSELTKEGKAYFSRGSFSDALSCFQYAKAMGSVRSSDVDPLSEDMTDERLMLWLSLSKVRARKQSRRSKSIDISKVYLGSGRLDIVSLHSSTATVHDCVDACILARIYIYLDDLSQAEKICDAAQARLGKLRKSVPDPQSLDSTYLEYQYQRAILVMVEIMYSRGFTEYTKAWRRRVSMDILRMETVPLLLHKKESNKSYDTASSENLSQAVRAGCFFSALYILSNFKPGSLKMAIYPLGAPTISEIRDGKVKTRIKSSTRHSTRNTGATSAGLAPTTAGRNRNTRDRPLDDGDSSPLRASRRMRQKDRKEPESPPSTDSDDSEVDNDENDGEDNTVQFDKRLHYLFHAMKSDCPAIVSLLIQHWDDITNISPVLGEIFHDIAGTDDRAKKSKALFLAIDYNLPKAVEHLLSIGAGKDQARQKAAEGETTCYDLSQDCHCSPLGYAISLGRTEICRLLLKSGAAVNGPGGKIEPPLHIAIRSWKGRPVVPLLIEAGADLNLKFKNVRPLALAVAQTGSRRNFTSDRISREKMVQSLLDNGADAKKSSFISSVWKTPLQQTVGDVYLKDVEKILRRRPGTSSRAPLSELLDRIWPPM